ncbi:MAG: molybdopterin synthase catalytic subunit [Actinomycetota bacterium]|nr:molybdopterin synthase catalytic subunit [Actinomycetota bacterium]
MAEPAGRTAVAGAAGVASAAGAAGRTGAVRLVDVREQALSVEEVLAAVADPAAGGTALFVGTVRADDGGRAVSSLGYEAHPDAVTVMRAVAEEVAAAPGVIAVAALHRTGLLSIGDLAVVVAAACGHRDVAFEAGRQLIDEVKARVPIWKRQTFLDGEVEWVGIET